MATNWEKGFVQGYMCAVATLIRTHDDGQIAEDVLAGCYYNTEKLRAYGVEEYDIEVLEPIIKEIKRKKNLK